jgi:CheY-like chemotaxis protein
VETFNILIAEDCALTAEIISSCFKKELGEHAVIKEARTCSEMDILLSQKVFDLIVLTGTLHSRRNIFLLRLARNNPIILYLSCSYNENSEYGDADELKKLEAQGMKIFTIKKPFHDKDLKQIVSVLQKKVLIVE